MRSYRLAVTEIKHRNRAEDVARAHEIAERYPGWHVWTARKGDARIATRTGDQHQPDGNDDVWAQTVIGDDWSELEEQLKVQAQADALRTYKVQA